MRRILFLCDNRGKGGFPMAVTSMMQRLLDNALTAKFAKSLDQNDLPEGWADNPEIVQLAEDAYSVMGTESPWFKSWFGKSKVVDENKDPKHIYHGTARGDRVGNEFRKDRATSGPMAYFTDNYGMAESYAKNKADTSISREGWDNDWYKQFVLSRNGREVPVANAFWSLPKAKRDEIAAKAGQIGLDDDGNIAFIPGNTLGTGGYLQHLKQAGGNPVKALYKEWLDSGNLYGEDEKYFQDVLKLAGLDDVIYKDPRARAEKVYDVFLSSQKPFDPSNINKTTLERLRSAGRRAEKYYDPDKAIDSDSWDKTRISPMEWLDDLERDVEKGSTLAWVTVPDWVTETLKKRGYDSIVDKGGKYSGEAHTVHIPFEPTQIKAASNRGTFNLKDPNIYKGIIPAVGAGGLLSLMGPEEAEAAIPDEKYVFPAQKRGTVLYEPGLESPLVDPADILTAPIGAVGAGAKAAAMAAEPFISYGMDKAINGLLGLFSDEEE
ncbi:MAG: hypothetical protein IKW19_09890 [Akkermansia sp.]|nr:hypothetical protein [Akkermansia sp.]